MATRLYKISVGEGEFAVAEGAGSAVASDTVELTVELATTASFEPPVSSAVSNSGSEALNPTGTLPAPKATHVPNPRRVPGLVLLVALM